MNIKNTLALILTALGLVSLSIPAQASGQPIVGQIIAGHGRPNRITVITAFSCPFCKAFDRQAGVPELLDWQKRGYEVEIVSVVAFPSDRYWSALVACGDIRGYLARQRRLFEAQSMISITTESNQRNEALDLAKAMGLSLKQANSCLSPTSLHAEEIRTAKAKKLYDYGGTPSTYLNGKFLGNGFNQVNEAIRQGRR